MKADAEDIFTSDLTNNAFAEGQKGDLPWFETTDIRERKFKTAIHVSVVEQKVLMTVMSSRNFNKITIQRTSLVASKFN